MPLNLAQVPDRREGAAVESCYGKARLTRDVAAKVARRMSQAKSAGLHPYRCSFCEAWHIGSQLKRRG